MLWGKKCDYCLIAWQMFNVITALHTEMFVTVKIIKILHQYRGTTVAQWLRCSATNRKITGLIPAGVTGIFH